MNIKFAPFDVGEIVYFKQNGSGYKKYTRAEIVKIGIDKSDQNPRNKESWRCKIAINGKTLKGYWGAGWFNIATTRTPNPK